MNTTDKVAILLASYNGEKFIREQIDSLLGQTCRDWELFIHDDGSIDKTVEIVQEYAARIPESIHVIEGPPTGSAKNNFFFLMRSVQAPYYMFCDQDDIWKKDKLSKFLFQMTQVEASNGKDKPTLVFSDLEVVDEKLSVVSKSMNQYQTLYPDRIQFKDLMIQNVITGCASMINRACRDKAMLLSDTESVIMHDWWCALIAAQFGSISYIDEPLVEYRQHSDNSVGAKNISSLKYIANVLGKTEVIKKNLAATRLQTGVFVGLFSDEATSTAAQYADLACMNKFGRLLFYAKNRVRKCGIARNLGLLVFG